MVEKESLAALLPEMHPLLTLKANPKVVANFRSLALVALLVLASLSTRCDTLKPEGADGSSAAQTQVNKLSGRLGERPIQSLDEFLAQQELKDKNDKLASLKFRSIERAASSLRRDANAPGDRLQVDATQNLGPEFASDLRPTTARPVAGTDSSYPLKATASPISLLSQQQQAAADQLLQPTSSPKPKPILQHHQVRHLLNVTTDYPLPYSSIIFGYIWPLIAAITLFTNLMIVFVLTQRDMRTPTNVVLTAIAIADIIPIVVPVPWFIYLFAMTEGKQVLHPPVACYFYQHSTRSVSEIFYFLSTWLNVLLAIQDYLTACRPRLARKYCQIRVVVVEIVLLTLLAFLVNLPQLLKIVYKEVKFYYNGQLTYGCKGLQAKWFKDLVGEYAPIYDDIFNAIIIIFVDGGPAAILITLTALLIRQLQRQRIQGHLLMEQARTASKRRRERHRQQEYESSARVMIFVLLAFLAVKIPFATTFSLMIVQSRFGIEIVEQLADFQKVITITDLVFVLSYPLNFTIFCCCSKKFRHKCTQLLGECSYSTKTKTNRWMSNISDSFASANSYTFDGDKRDSVATVSSCTQRNSLANSTKKQSLVSTASGQNPESRAGHRPSANVEAQSNKRSSLSALLRQESIEAAKKRLANCRRSRAIDDQDGGSIGGGQRREHSPEVASFQPKRERLATESAGESSSVDAFCDGRNHLELDVERGDKAAPVDADFRALLEDGSLCLECVLRYEQLKRTKLGEQKQRDSLQALEHYRRQLNLETRRVSGDSIGWPIAIPPPPPPLRLESGEAEQLSVLVHPQPAPRGGGRLPCIVTTRCESLRERSVETSASSGSAAEVSTTDHRASSFNPHELMMIDSDSSRRASSHEEQTSPTSATSGSQAAVGRQRTRRKLRWPRQSAMSRSNSRVSSDPGAPVALLSVRQLGAFMRVGRLGGSDDSRQVERQGDSGGDSPVHKSERRKVSRAQPSNLGETRQRSLSLSNSNLSTLPNATGILADVFISTLLNAAAGNQLGVSETSGRRRARGQRARRE